MPIPRILLSTLALGVLVATNLTATASFAQQAPAPSVIVAPAKIMDLRESVDFTGRLVAVQKVDIHARVSGFLEKINFTEGKKVTAGTVLYEVEDGSYQAALQQVEGSLAAAQAQHDLAVIERDRQRQLFASNTTPQSKVDIAEAQLKKAEADLVSLEGSKAKAELDLSYTKITAPFDGIVGLTTADVGALVGPDSGALVTLTRLDPIYVQFPVATALLLEYREGVKSGKYSGGANVGITLPNGRQYPEKGTVDFIASNVSQGTDTVIVRAAFDNADSTLLDGTLVRVNLEQEDKQEVLAVPEQAIQRDQQGAFVMVVGTDSKVELRRVDVTRSARGQAVIASGLKEGEQVITDGVGKVRPSATVDATPAAGG
ncbi:membrane fusion protein (multidrug efflux system) [Pararhizobium capsulatum DSM 1112]|uniref:Membrane fusion protein (Multidrug efflux system) n=1 Tax=Pararhizobium capsulatum DSM 1112 TaxID=1121113 RepID=A0ABU0BLP8_9HYPH|nr:efflux RND transporter periplasmic adaptor subunit [Pararhizobium capsulatum]MDQ0318380.1 membrane fusion protein (multidrug efflux system) [Pararhizobium capsulatum DSM 1112]